MFGITWQIPKLEALLEPTASLRGVRCQGWVTKAGSFWRANSEFSFVLAELQQYYNNQGRFPDSRVMLCFGEEFPDAVPLRCKLILVQVWGAARRRVPDRVGILPAELHALQPRGIWVPGLGRKCGAFPQPPESCLGC